MQIKFRPAVFVQRNHKLQDIFADERWSSKINKLVDFGCAKIDLNGFLRYIVNLNQIYYIDIDLKILKEGICNAAPSYDFKTIKPREVGIFLGSIGDPDDCLLNADAVSAMEVIEHLYPDILEAVPYNIFGFIRPKLAVISTPNADFNVLFENVTKFRSDKHKFEWTRQQFEDWATNITNRYPDYTVTFCAAGMGPENTEHLGGCSHIAVFVRKDLLKDTYVPMFSTPCLCEPGQACTNHICRCICPKCSPTSSYGICTYYSCSTDMIKEMSQGYNGRYRELKRYDAPSTNDPRSNEEIVVDCWHKRVFSYGAWDRHYVKERDRVEIPVMKLIKGYLRITKSELCNILRKHQIPLEDCVQADKVEPCLIYPYKGRKIAYRPIPKYYPSKKEIHTENKLTQPDQEPKENSYASEDMNTSSTEEVPENQNKNIQDDVPVVLEEKLNLEKVHSAQLEEVVEPAQEAMVDSDSESLLDGFDIIDPLEVMDL